MKKRSLLVATAMLLVAVLAATGATYAWFTSISSATTNISMGVQTASSLEISADGTNWVSYLDAEDLGLTGLNWSDHSTVNGKDFFTKSFYSDTEIEADASLAGQIKEFVESAPVSTTIYFRSTESGDVIFNSGSLTQTGSKANKSAALRVSVGENKIYANADTTLNAAISAEGAATGSVYGAQTAKAITGGNVVALADGGDGYFKGQATFTFWMEGTDSSNANAGGTAVANFIFAQDN